MILDTQLTYAKNEVWTKVQIEYKLFRKTTKIMYDIEIDHYSTHWILKDIVPGNVFTVSVRVIFIRLILSLKFCILLHIDIFCIRQLLHRVRGWLGIGMTYLEFRFLRKYLQMIRLIYFSIQNDWNNLSFIFLSFFSGSNFMSLNTYRHQTKCITISLSLYV